MEDYSQNGTIQVYDMKDYSKIPNEIKELMGVWGKDELLRSFIDINDNNFKMMDFDSIPWKDSYYETAADKCFNLRFEEEKSDRYLIR